MSDRSPRKNELEKHRLKVKPHQAGQRLDIALTELMPDLSRRKIRSIIDMGGCFLNRKRARISSHTVNAGDTIELEYVNSLLKSAKQPKFSLSSKDIIYQDDDIVAINKPPGLPSQATQLGAKQHILALLNTMLKENGERYTPHLIHRLDKETSGVLLVAKGKRAAEEWDHIFKERKIEKYYEALCLGRLSKKKLSIKNYLTRINSNTGLVNITADKQSHSRSAHTDVELIQYQDHWKVSHVRCQLWTGRSHQIRVHLASIGVPILGDKKYNLHAPTRLPADCQSVLHQHHLLHAKKVIFIHPKNKKEISITAPEPKNWQIVINQLFKDC